ncbi:hypothetical protein ACTXT7_002190 [Hymenolepis weldensis]
MLCYINLTPQLSDDNVVLVSPPTSYQNEFIKRSYTWPKVMWHLVETKRAAKKKKEQLEKSCLKNLTLKVCHLERRAGQMCCGSRKVKVKEKHIENYYKCGVHKANKADRITYARTSWKVRYVTGCIENKRGHACRDLLSQSAIKIPAA